MCILLFGFLSFTEGPDGSSLSLQKKNNTLGVVDPSFNPFHRGARQTRVSKGRVGRCAVEGGGGVVSSVSECTQLCSLEN